VAVSAACHRSRGNRCSGTVLHEERRPSASSDPWPCHRREPCRDAWMIGDGAVRSSVLCAAATSLLVPSQAVVGFVAGGVDGVTSVHPWMLPRAALLTIPSE